MKILFIYRCPQMGYSIDNVFRPIEKKMREKCKCDSITFNKANYKPLSMIENIVRVRKYMRKHPDTIIHITGSEHYLLPFIKKYKTVLTVHDLGFYTEGKKTLRTYFKYILWIKTLTLADKVTFISEKSLKEAKQFINFKEKQSCVIMNPVSEDFKLEKNSEPNKAKHTILHVGTRSNKNLERTIQAVYGINAHLRIIGSLNEIQKKLLDEYKINFSQVENISNEQVIEEYNNCDIVCFASTYEGFGMPIIEGQAMGKVVVTSNLSPMKEIANGSCSLVDPFDIQSIHYGIIDAIENYNKYKNLGNKNIERFSIDTKVEEYLDIYKQI